MARATAISGKWREQLQFQAKAEIAKKMGIQALRVKQQFNIVRHPITWKAEHTPLLGKLNTLLDRKTMMQYRKIGCSLMKGMRDLSVSNNWHH